MEQRSKSHHRTRRKDRRGVLEEMQTEFEDDLRISGVKDWQHYLMGIYEYAMLHDAMNTNAASVQDTHMYEKAMNDVQRLRIAWSCSRIQIEKMTGLNSNPMNGICGAT